jgi:glycosyltransferase involved in cell wall biosynthesis
LVIVAHPGTQHSARTARALKRTGYLDRYLTSFIWRQDRGFGRGLRFARGTWARRLERELGRRSAADVGPEAVQVLPGMELLHVIASRCGFSSVARRALWLRNELFDRRVAAEVERRRPAAVLCYDSCALHTFRAARRLGILTLLDQSASHIRSGMAMLRHEAESGPTGATRPGSVPRWLVERCTEEAWQADYVLAPSAYVQSTLVANGIDPSRIVWMPFGVDVDRFRPAEARPAGPFRILFVGQISRLKGIRYLLDAFDQLRLPDVELVLVGGVKNPRALKTCAGTLTHIPHVPHGEVHHLFREADVFVYPSLHEGSALAIYEALASGLPVITTFNSGSVVRDGIDGYLVPVRDTEAIKEKLFILYSRPELRRDMSRNARKRAEEFTWDAYQRRMGAFLGSVLRRRLFAAEEPRDDNR